MSAASLAVEDDGWHKACAYYNEFLDDVKEAAWSSLSMPLRLKKFALALFA